MIDLETIQKLIENGTDEDKKLAYQYLLWPYYSFRPREDNPDALDEQESFYNEKVDGIACVLAGNASGKTYTCCAKVAKLLIETEAPSDLCKYFIVSETMEMAGNIWAEKLKEFIRPELIDDIVWHSAKKEYPQTVIMKPGKNGNRWMIVFRSFKQGRKLFQAFSKVYGYWIDEQCPLDILNELDTRCREYHNPGTKLYSLTPLQVDDDLRKLYEDPPETWKFYRMNSEECFKAGQISTLQWLDNTPEDMKSTRKFGDFLNFSGAIFKEFDEKIHVIKPFNLKDLPQGTEIYRAIDFGYKHETTCIWLAYCRHLNRFWAVREWGAANLLIDEKVAAIKKEFPGTFRTFADPEDAQQRAEFSKLGIPTSAAQKEPVVWGIELVRMAMSLQEDGEPGLYIFDNCESLIDQIKGYRWRDVSKKAIDDAAQKPVKRNDDYVDSLRMGIHSLQKSDLSPWDMSKSLPKNMPSVIHSNKGVPDIINPNKKEVYMGEEIKKDEVFDEIPSARLIAWCLQFATADQVSDMINDRVDTQFVLLTKTPNVGWQMWLTPVLDGKPVIKILGDILKMLKKESTG